MVEYYFDTETTGINPLKDKIITIQWQQLNGFTGAPIDDLHILKEWESSEEAILKNFLPIFKSENPFNFIMVGKNLWFDFMFMSHRAKKYGLDGLDLRYFYSRVSLDLKPVLVMINKGRSKGYDGVMDKKGSLAKVDIPKLYKEGKYPEIIDYIKKETKLFIEVYQILKREMPTLGQYWAFVDEKKRRLKTK